LTSLDKSVWSVISNMNKTSRKDLIKKLVEQKKLDKMLISQSKKAKEVDFIAFVDPTENDVMDELSRFDSYVSSHRKN
jgi:hypothetical protein